MNYPAIPREFFNGDCFDAYRILGAHPCSDNGIEGWRFAVWAPGATAVEVCGGFDRDQITLRVSGGGPAGVVIACTDGTGNVKGCIDHPLVELPAKPNGHLDVGGAVGKDGVLTVIRDNRLQKEPTVGQVPLVSGEIAEDLTAYYAYSEQVRVPATACSGVETMRTIGSTSPTSTAASTTDPAINSVTVLPMSRAARGLFSAPTARPIVTVAPMARPTIITVIICIT